MPKTYREVLERYDRAKAFGEERSLADYAQHLNDIYETQDFSEGLRDGLWTRASTRLDQALSGQGPYGNELTGLPGQVLGEVGGAIGGAFGHEDAGRQVGQGLPRMLIDTLPLYALNPVAGALATGAAFAGKTYADTGSPFHAAVSGVTGAVLPGASRFGGRIGASLAGGERVAGDLVSGAINEVLAPTAEKAGQVAAGRFLGSQAAQLGTFATGEAITAKHEGRNFDLFTPEYLLQQIPFTVFDAVHMARAKVPTADVVKKQLVQPEAKVDTYVPPPGSPEANEKLQAFIDAATADPAKTGDLINAVNGVIPPVRHDTVPDEPLTFSGWGVKTGAGHKFYVESDAAGKGEFDGKTVFLNGGEEPVLDPTSGQYIVQTNRKSVGTNVTHPLLREDFVKTVDPLQPDLPERPADVAPTSIGEDVAPGAEPELFAAMDETFPKVEQRVLEEMGVGQDKVAASLLNPAPLREAAARYEIAKQQETAALTTVANPLEDAVAIAQVLPPEVAVKRVAEVDGTPTQKVQSAVLQEATPQVDSALQDQATEKYKVSSEWNNKQQNIYGEALRDERGKRLNFLTRAEAEQWKVENLAADQGTFVVRDGGRNTNGTHRGFYLAPIENITVSLDAQRGEGTDLHNIVTQADMDVETMGFDVPVTERPKESREGFLSQLDKAAENPDLFSSMSDFDLEDAPHALAQAQTVLPMIMDGEVNLKTLNAALEKAGLDTFDSMFELQGHLKDVRRGVKNYEEAFRSPTLGSSVPHDPALVDEIGVLKGGRAVVDWIAAQQVPIISELAGAFKNFPDVLDRLQLIVPGDPRWTPNDMFFMLKAEGPVINVGWFPDAASKQDFAKDMAHEIAHHMDIESAGRTDPAALEYAATKTRLLESLRQSKQIPKDVRAVLAKSVAEGWYKNSTRENSFVDKVLGALGQKKGVEWLNVLYGLQNEQEMVAQTFSNHQFIALMAGTKVGGTGFARSVLNIFSAGFSKLFGLKTENALETLLGSFDNYLTAGSMRNTYNGREYIRDTLFKQGVHPDAVASRMRTVDRTFTKGDLLGSISGFVREGEAGILPPTVQQEFRDVDQPLRTALISGDTKGVYDTTMSLLAEQLPVHQELLFRMKQDVKTAQGLYSEIKAGRVNGAIPPNGERGLAHSLAKIDRMEAALRKQGLALERWNELEGLTPDGWTRNVAAELGEKFGSPSNDLPEGETVRTLIARERAAGKKQLSWFAKTFALTQHFAELYPAAKTVIGRVNQIQGDAIARMKLLTGAISFNPTKSRPDGTIGDFDPEIQKRVEKVLKSERLLNVASDLFRWQNKEGQSKELNLGDDFVKRQLNGLNPQDREAVLQVIQSQKGRQIAWTNVLGSGLTDLNVANTGVLIASSERGMLPETARDLSKQIYSAMGQVSDPVQAAVGVETLRALASKMTPDTYLKALQHAQTLHTKTRDYMEYIQKNPGYVSEQRYGSDKLVMVGPDGTKSTDSGTNAELQKIRAKREKTGYTVLDYIAAEDAQAPRFGMREDMLTQLEALDSLNENLVRQMLPPEIAAQVLPRIGRAGDIRSSMAAAAPLPTVKRAFREGRENINMLDNANQFYQRSNNWLRNRLLRAETALDMSHPEVAGNPELSQYLSQHVENFSTSDNPTARKFVETIAFAKLGMDLGQAALESIQHATTGLSALIGETGSITDAIGLLAKTTKDVWKRKATKRWDNPEHAKLADYLAERGHGYVAEWGDFADADIGTSGALAGPVSKGVSIIKNGARSFSAIWSRYNDQVVTHAAYDLARAQGRSVDDAMSFALNVKERGLYTGGKAQRAVGLWSIKSKPVPQLLGALQNYTLGWFSQMAENYVKGFGKAPAGLTETQRIGAKKAFAYSLFAQAALAGALGLPAVGQGLALFQQVTGVDGKGWLRQNLAKTFDEDEEFGGMLTSLALRGVGSAGLPFDPSGRTSVSIPFIGVDSYKGFNVASLAGAGGSTVSDFVSGMLGLLRGDTRAGSKLLPNALKRPYQLWEGEGDIRDQRGGLLQKLSGPERFFMAIGLTPSRVQTAKDISEAVKKANDTAQRKAESQADEVATIYRKQGEGAAKARMLELQQENPKLDLRVLAGAVKNRVIAQTLPYDARRALRPDADIQGLSTGIAPSEVVRQQLGNQVGGALGLRPSRPGRTTQLDAFLEANPYESLAGARRGVGAARPARPLSGYGTLPSYLQESP